MINVSLLNLQNPESPPSLLGVLASTAISDFMSLYSQSKLCSMYIVWGNFTLIGGIKYFR